MVARRFIRVPALPLAALILVLFVMADVSASPRTALVIGNSRYQISPLKNPVNDATDMANTLTQFDFDVNLQINADHRTMVRAIRDFGRTIKKHGGVGLFYYAGHGIQVRGRNYLIPLGAVIESEGDAQFEAVDAGFVLSKMQDAGNDMNIVILDACRNNPFARNFRSSAQGLARMDAPKGSIVAYATAPGELAADGSGRNGIYTKHLIQNIQAPQLKLEDVFKNVRRAVVMETANKQVPWESSSLMGQFYFSAPEPSPPPQQTPPESDKSDILTKQAEILFWDSIQNSTDPAMFEAFLLQFPDGIFANLATMKITQLTRARQSALIAKKDSVPTVTENKPTPPQRVKPAEKKETITETGTTYSGFVSPPATQAVSAKKQPETPPKTKPAQTKTEVKQTSPHKKPVDTIKTEPAEVKVKKPVKTDMVAALDVKVGKPDVETSPSPKKDIDSFLKIAVFPFKPAQDYWNQFVLNSAESFFLQNKKLKLIASFYENELTATNQAVNQGKEKPFLPLNDKKYNFDRIWGSKQMSFGRAKPHIQEISDSGKTLGADYILTGSVFSSHGDPVSGRISLFLIDVNHNKMVSEKYSSSDMESDCFHVSNSLIEKMFEKISNL